MVCVSLCCSQAFIFLGAMQFNCHHSIISDPNISQIWPESVPYPLVESTSVFHYIIECCLFVSDEDLNQTPAAYFVLFHKAVT